MYLTANPAVVREMARAIHEKMRSALSSVASADLHFVTGAVLSGAIGAYQANNPGRNAFFASADKRRIHILEQHPDIIYDRRNPPLDLYITGGFFSMGLESEFGGPRNVIADFNKLEAEAVEDFKVLVTRAMSWRQRTKHLGRVQSASASDGGCYTLVDLYLPKDAPGCAADVTTICYLSGQILYDSRPEDERRKLRERMFASIARPCVDDENFD